MYARKRFEQSRPHRPSPAHFISELNLYLNCRLPNRRFSASLSIHANPARTSFVPSLYRLVPNRFGSISRRLYQLRVFTKKHPGYIYPPSSRRVSPRAPLRGCRNGNSQPGTGDEFCVCCVRVAKGIDVMGRNDDSANTGLGWLMKTPARVLLWAVIGLGAVHPALGQSRCENAPDYFAPVTSGDGQRFPLAIGPLVWHLVGSGVYPVKGSDGQTHLAFAVQFTNAWNLPATIRSVEVVDPSAEQ